MGLLVYFVPSFVIFFVAVFLFFRQRRCILERAAECEVWGDPNNFVPLANVPEWVTLLQKLCHHYYMTSEFRKVFIDISTQGSQLKLSWVFFKIWNCINVFCRYFLFTWFFVCSVSWFNFAVRKPVTSSPWLFPKKWEGREKALASAGHVSLLNIHISANVWILVLNSPSSLAEGFSPKIH